MDFTEFLITQKDFQNTSILHTINASSPGQKLTNNVIEIGIICCWDFNECSKLRKKYKNIPFWHTFNASTGQKLTIIVIEIVVISYWDFNGF